MKQNSVEIRVNLNAVYSVPSGCKEKNHIAPNIYSWDGAIIIKCPMNDSAPSAVKKLTDVLRGCLKKKCSQEWLQPTGWPLQTRLAASGSSSRCPSRPPARAAGVSGRPSRSALRSLCARRSRVSGGGNARLRPATLSIRSAARRGVHALAERSVRARPGGAAGGGGSRALPPGAARPRWKCGSFLGAADR